MRKTDSCEGHRERLRNKFLKGGIHSLNDYELLELLLTYSIPRRDVKPLAKNLIGKFASLSGVFNASTDQLSSLDGLGERSIALIKLVHASHVKYFEEKMLSSNSIANPEDVINFSKVYIGGEKDENIMAIFCDSKNKVRSYEILSAGIIDQASLHPRKITEKAFEKKSNAVIIVHNHPSGDLNPSPQDINLTKSVKAALQLIEVRFLDHIIVNSSGYFSFLEKGLL